MVDTERRKQQKRDAVKRWREANPEKARTATDRWQAENPEKRKEIGRRWYEENKELAQERGRQHYAKNRERYAILGREKRRKERLTCFDAYGGRFCGCCAESHIEFLTIDHINGGGNKHRKEMNRSSLYGWLICNNFPSGYRVLCYNCNCARGHYGYCPHEQGQQSDSQSEDPGPAL